MKVLILDNYDSFTYNLVQLVREEPAFDVTVIRNDEIDLATVADYDKIIISPGPGLPKESGKLCALIEQYQDSKPMLGVCLGMQAMAEVAGGSLLNMEAPKHGVANEVTHDGSLLFTGIPSPFKVGRYHSWAVKADSLPDVYTITAEDETGLPMAMQHLSKPLYAVQFHPESILTEHGKTLMMNFLNADV